jgi:hypothetical protein
MCWVQYATPIMILILPFQSIGSNPSTAKGKAKTLQLDYKDYRVDIKKLDSINKLYHGGVHRVFHSAHIPSPSSS